MRHRFALLFTLTLAVSGLVHAGEPVVSRRQFKETVTYPFIFKPDNYLAGRGPLPMRFSAAGPSCEKRQPPAPPPFVKNEAVPDLSATDAKPSAEQPAEPAPTPSAVVETTAKHEQPDFAKIPDEVLDFFKNTEGRPVRRAYLFDPIFQPVMPNDLPKSKATSQQK